MRRAGETREFVTLDNITRALDPNDLLIADSDKPLAIAGVMGGLNSEVSDSTTTILLESAYFEPMTIARTARRHWVCAAKPVTASNAASIAPDRSAR